MKIKTKDEIMVIKQKKKIKNITKELIKQKIFYKYSKDKMLIVYT